MTAQHAARTTDALRIALIDDSELSAAGLAALLTPFADRVVLVEPRAAIAEPDVLDVVLFDPASLGGMAQSMLRDLTAHSEASVAVFSWSDDAAGHELATTAPRLAKTLTASQIVRALEEIAEGRYRPITSVASSVTAPVVEAGEPALAPVTKLRDDAGLTPREAGIVELIVGGLSNQEIADQLCLSINSVKTYIRGAYRKMGVDRRTQAVLWGLEHGMTPHDDAAVPAAPEVPLVG